MTRLAAAVQQYLALRKSLGYKLYLASLWLPDFASFLDAHGSSVITTALAVKWARLPAKASPPHWAHRLSVIRQFARHHRAFDARTEVPPVDMIPYRAQRLIPHVYTAEQVTALMYEAACLSFPLRAASYEAILGLLAVTGMRVSEVLALNDDDLDGGRQLLTIRSSKFGKSRHVPLHSTTLAALRDYACRRDQLRPHHKCPAFFISSRGGLVFLQNLNQVFPQLLERAGLDRGPGRRPRIHDLRHSFVINTVRDWYRAEVDVERRIPWLSTYLGHTSPVTTYWYLTATPELLTAAAVRAERAWKVRL
jgi:integrase/recombinase XerD